MSAAIEAMKGALERQRAAFLRAPYPSLSARQARLKGLRRALQRHQDHLVEAISADFGGRSPTESKLSDLMGTVLHLNHTLRNLSRWMKPRRRPVELLFLTNRAWVEYQPKGVVGVIAPWNFPVYLSLGPLITALAAGNRVMIKTSELSPRTTEVLAGLLAECLPQDEAAVFGGSVEEARVFSRLPFDHLVFTGSPSVGRQVMAAAAEGLTPVTLELGGKSPLLVARGQALEEPARRAAHGKALNGGQVCVAPDYALVPRESVDAFAAAVADAFLAIYPEAHQDQEYTAQVSERHAQRVQELLEDARAKGGRVISCGGGAARGRRIPLHVVTGVRDDMRIAHEELFGPILPVVAYGTIEDAIAYVQARPRPLAMYPFGFARDELRQLMTRVHAGGVCVNDCLWHILNHSLPFGGIGNSGMGSYHGEEGFRELSHAKAVFRRHRLFPIGLFYPPYGNLAQRLATRLFLGRPGRAPGLRSER